MAWNCNSDDVSTFLSNAFQWIKEKCLWIWSFVVAIVAVFTSTTLMIWTITTFLIVTAALLLAAGIYALVTWDIYISIIEGTFFFLPIFLIVTAGVIFLTAMLGHYGVTREKYDFVVAYMTLLAVILLIESSIVGISSQMHWNTFQDSAILQRMNDSMTNFINNKNGRDYYYGYYSQERRDAALWSTMQQELHCCGFNGVSDFGYRIPVSCCDLPTPTFEPLVCSAETAYTTGCYDALSWMLNDHLIIIFILATVVTGVQLIITVLAACLTYRLKTRQEIPYKGLLETPVDQESKSGYFTQYQTIPGQIVCEPPSSGTS